MALGCGSSSDESGSGKPQPQLAGAQGVGIWQVAIYQASKRVLALDGAPQQANVSIVAGRDALVRVYYSVAPESVGKQVVGRLEIAGQPTLETNAVLADASYEENLGTTINFEVPGAMLAGALDYRVSILEEGKDDNPTAHHPQQGTEVHSIDGPATTLRVMFVPFAYNADGSGRVPDLSPEKLEIYRQRLLQLYPVANVETQVREPVPFAGVISADGNSGWQDVGFQLYSIRNAEKPGEDWYYYGIFNPSDNFWSYCGAGCLLGVTLLNDQPADVGSEALRLALGVGFEEYGPGTAAHELGHAHGRRHVACNGPADVDPAYPYPGNTIGPWGWNIVNKQELIDPAVYSDIMGYCDDQWISDYNFEALLYRSSHVNAPRLYTPSDSQRFEMVTVDGSGHGTWRRDAGATTALRSTANSTVTVTRTDGSSQQVEGHFFGYDHLPGGWLMFPEQPSDVVSLSATIGGAHVKAVRHLL